MPAVKLQILAKIVDVIVDLIKKKAFQEFFSGQIDAFKKHFIRRKGQNIK